MDKKMEQLFYALFGGAMLVKEKLESSSEELKAWQEKSEENARTFLNDLAQRGEKEKKQFKEMFKEMLKEVGASSCLDRHLLLPPPTQLCSISFFSDCIFAVSAPFSLVALETTWAGRTAVEHPFSGRQLSEACPGFGNTGRLFRSKLLTGFAPTA